MKLRKNEVEMSDKRYLDFIQLYFTSSTPRIVTCELSRVCRLRQNRHDTPPLQEQHLDQNNSRCCIRNFWNHVLLCPV